MFHEIAAIGAAQVLICADMNCTLDRVQELSKALSNRTLYDLGAMEHLAGEHTEAPTCWAHGAKKGNRRDFVLANARMMKHIVEYRVTQGDGFDVHDPITVTVRFGRPHRASVVRVPDQLRIPEGVCSDAAQRSQWCEGLKHAMDRKIEDTAEQLRGAVENRDMDELWRIWSCNVEHAYIQYCQLPPEDAIKCRGHGAVQVVTKPSESPVR
eukprot:9133616-Alexandrium_andersonii.AAC.1